MILASRLTVSIGFGELFFDAVEVQVLKEYRCAAGAIYHLHILFNTTGARSQTRRYNSAVISSILTHGFACLASSQGFYLISSGGCRLHSFISHHLSHF
jgi:hypothetical protein